jgi:site-specific recombinase XerD
MNMLIEHKIQQEEEKAKLGSVWKNSNAVFTNTKGNFLGSRLLNDHLQKLLQNNNFIRGLTVHGLRHALASILINDGESVATDAMQLGHANPSVTLKIYTHAFQSARARVANAIEAKLTKKPSEVSTSDGET